MNIFLLFFSIVGGLAIALVALMPLIPQRSIGKGFFRFNCFLSLALLLPFLIFNPYQKFQVPFLSHISSTASPLLTATAATAFLIFGISLGMLLLLFAFGKRPVSPFPYAWTILWGFLAFFSDSFLYLPRTGGPIWLNLLIPMHFLSSAGLLGAAMFAMLLGHWYLVQFDLDKKLLKRVSSVYAITIAFRILIFAVTLLLFFRLDLHTFHSLVSITGHGIFFWSRLLIGLAFPLLLAFLIYSTAKMGANQSCTGLLYIAVLFVLMGEMISRYLFFLKGVPI